MKHSIYLMTVLFLAGASYLRAGTFSTGAWTDDASTGITTAKTIWAYHFGSANAATVNSVAVPGIASTSPSPYTRTEFDLAGLNDVIPDDPNSLSNSGGSASAVVARSFIYGGNPGLLTLKYLTPGSPYTVTFLSVGWDPSGARDVTFSTGAGGDSLVVNQNKFGENNGIRVDYSFTATNTTQVVTLTPQTAATFHLYGLALRSGFIVTSTANSGADTLRQAFTDAEAIPGPDTITIAANVTTALSLSSPIAVADTVTVDATGRPAGATVTANGGSRHFTLNAEANLTLRRLTLIDGNSVANGGSILNSAGLLELWQCTLSGNQSDDSGGAIFNTNAGYLTAASCTFSSNFAATNGGALANGSEGGATLTRCTFTANTHTGTNQGGGAINHANVASSMILTHCTLAGNSTTGSDGGGGIRTRGPGFYMENCIVAGNTADNGTGADIYNTTDLNDFGANIVQSRAGSGAVSGTLIQADPLLAPLGSYGGPTPTRALLPGSPARNNATVLSPPQTADQRGFPIVEAPDIGAYEAGTPSNYNAWIYETLPVNATPEQHGGASDYDNDGATNESEWTALTNPAGNQAILRLTDCSFDITTSTVTFSTLAGLPYQLQSFHNPEALLWQNEGSSVVGTGSPMTLPVTRSDVGPNFFRVVEGPPPPSVAMVKVGNPGNADDTRPNDLGGNSGKVDYEYKIGKYEVTNGEYCTFLNAVDPIGQNLLALYKSQMASSTFNGGIILTGGNPSGAKYVVKAGFANKPVVYVSFYDAMRFCNWLHNGAQAGGDTENGAYTLRGNSATPSNGTTVTRNAGAKFALPSEDEWYKAAYHQPAELGVPEGDYWQYPTRSNTPPNASGPPAFEPPGTAPAANYNGGLNGRVTEVGAYTTTMGFYGTFDMAGNTLEWEETISIDSKRVLRGGNWFSLAANLRSNTAAESLPDLEYETVGFRVASP